MTIFRAELIHYPVSKATLVEKYSIFRHFEAVWSLFSSITLGYWHITIFGCSVYDR